MYRLSGGGRLGRVRWLWVLWVNSARRRERWAWSKNVTRFRCSMWSTREAIVPWDVGLSISLPCVARSAGTNALQSLCDDISIATKVLGGLNNIHFEFLHNFAEGDTKVAGSKYCVCSPPTTTWPQHRRQMGLFSFFRRKVSRTLNCLYRL
jgi:hypothetical protein